jgi:hypothetical protein
VLLAVSLFVGLATFVRCVAINLEDARWFVGMSLLRRAYLEMVPELDTFFVTSHEPDVDRRPLRYGPRRRHNHSRSPNAESSLTVHGV